MAFCLLAYGLIKLADNVSTPTDQRPGFDATPSDFSPTATPAPGAGYDSAPPARAPHPDDPPWGVLAGVGVAVGMFVLMLALQIAFVVPYALTLRGQDPQKIVEILQNDKTVVLLSVLSIIPAHLLTLLLAWAVVTNFGKRPFWATLGWGWSPRFGRVEIFFLLGVTLAMLGTGQLMVLAFGDQETSLTRMLASSAATRYAVAALATFTAPLVEEVVYRGVLYSALRRRLGAAASVLAVVALFAAIHFPQYRESAAALVTITLLSLVLTVVRAWTGRLLPCFVIHLLFNGITSVFIVLAPQAAEKSPSPPSAPPAGALLQLLDPLTRLFA
jgi:uncharacterized protein